MFLKRWAVRLLCLYIFADTGDCQQGPASEAVGLEAREVHSLMEGDSQHACGQHDVRLHLYSLGNW